MAGLVMKLRASGISDRRLLVAIERIPRRLFLEARDQPDAALDRAFPLPCGQIASAPSTLATMLSALEIGPEDKVLEIGTGSGFQTAIIAHLAKRVVTLDRYRTLSDLARDRFETLRLDNVTTLVADGLAGYPKHAPYDRIVVNGAVESVPAPLLDQLMDGGVIVAPIGTGFTQKLVKLVKRERTFTRTELGEVRLIRLDEGVARKL
jgi:Protein-L-isoaspartate carboxylmethyltransferase